MPVDWWALGVLLFAMVVGSPPFFDEDPLYVQMKVAAWASGGGAMTKFPRDVDRAAKDVVNKLLHWRQEKRLGNPRKHKFYNDLNFEALLERSIAAPQRFDQGEEVHFDSYPDMPTPPPVSADVDRLFSSFVAF